MTYESDDRPREGAANEFNIAEPKWGESVKISANGKEPFTITKPQNALAVECLGALGNGLLALHYRICELESELKQLKEKHEGPTEADEG